MTSNYLLYLAFGDKDRNGLIKELTCSLLSFNKVCAADAKQNTQIIIYSSDEIQLPAALNNLKIDCQLLSKQEIDDLTTRNNGFNLALKIYVLDKFFKTVKEGNALFIDTDTFFMKDPTSLFQSIEKGYAIMHLMEPSIFRRPALRNYLSRKKLYNKNGDRLTISPHIEVWNSGVVGINHLSSPSLDAALHLIEQLTLDNNSHILEQLTLSYFLQQDKKILPSHDYVVHYYFHKPFVQMLDSYFNGDVTEEGNEGIQSTIDYQDLPKLLVRELKNSFIEWHFFCLPRNTQIGKLLIREYLYDKNYYKDTIRALWKVIFKTYKLWEYNLSDKMLKDRYSS